MNQLNALSNRVEYYGRPDKVDVARDFAVEEIAGIDHFGIDINSEQAVGEAPVRPGRNGAGQAPPSNSQMKARPGPLCSPKARIAPLP